MNTLQFLDILGFAVGLIYLYLEYRASIWLWVASVVMPAVDMVLYYKAGLYADFGMAVYYCLAAVYGYVAWKWPGIRRRIKLTSGNAAPGSEVVPESVRASGNAGAVMEEEAGHGITRFPRERIAPVAGIFALLWLGLWAFLSHATNSTVPVTDAFTTALSIVALWALARKYAEQWLLWLVVDLVCCALYTYKGIPFKAAIYGIYSLVAVWGYKRWLQLEKN